MKLIRKFDRALYRRMRHKRNRRHILIPTLLTTATLLILIVVLETVSLDLRSLSSSAIIFASFAGSAFILFMTPYSRASKVGRFVKSYVIASIFGEIGYLLSGIIGFYTASVIVIFCVALALFETDSTHSRRWA